MDLLLVQNRRSKGFQAIIDAFVRGEIKIHVAVEQELERRKSLAEPWTGDDATERARIHDTLRKVAGI